MNLKPLADRVVIEHVEQNEKSTGGIFLPDTAKEKPQEGIVRRGRNRPRDRRWQDASDGR